MNQISFKNNGWLSRLRSSIAGRLAVRVPDEVSCCEFDCRKTVCRDDDWEGCQQRLRYAERLRADRGTTPGQY